MSNDSLRPSLSVQVPGLRVAHVLLVDIVGFSTRPTSEQSYLIKHLVETAQTSETYSRANSAESLSTASTGDGFILAFWDDAAAPVWCAEEIKRSLAQVADYEVRYAIHSGAIEQVERDIAGHTNLAGEGINTAARILPFAVPGEILISERSAGLLAEMPGIRERIVPVGSRTAKHEQQLHLFKLLELVPQNLRVREQTWITLLDTANEIRTRALKKGSIRVAGREVIAQRLLRGRRELLSGVVVLLVALAIHAWAEHQEAGRKLQLWAYEKLQKQISSSGSNLPVVVVDIEDKYNDPQGYTRLDKLRSLIQAILSGHPSCIGIDIDFGYRDQEGRWLDDQGLITSLVLENATKTPIYLAVSHGERPPDTWLGDARLVPFAVHPYRPDEMLSGPLVMVAGLNTGSRVLPGLGEALASGYVRGHGDRHATGISGLTTTYSEWPSQNLLPENSLKAIGGKFYYLNMSALEQLKQEALHPVNADDIAQNQHAKDLIRGKAVLIASSTDDATWPNPITKAAEPNMYLHALAAYTQIAAPVSEFTRPFRWLLTALTGIVSFGVVQFARRMLIAAPEEVDTHRLTWAVALVSAAFVLGLGIWLARVERILWTDFFLIALMLASHPKIEQYMVSSVSALKLQAKRIYRTMVFEAQ